MTEQAESIVLNSSSAEEVAQCVERLVQETTEDLRKFRAEQAQLREQINEVLNENHLLTDEVGQYKQQIMSSVSIGDLKKRLLLTSDALQQAMSQISVLKKERHSLQKIQECSQKTINNMEKELNTYRSQMPLGSQEQMAEKYNKAKKLLEDRLTKQQEELRSQSDLIKSLYENRQRCSERIEYLEGKLDNHHRDAANQEDTQSKVKSLQKKVKEYEKALANKSKQLDESIKREMEAVRKVQESLAISEAAVQEKEDSERRAQSYKEEATTLAINIGGIMEEAAKRVDNEVAQLKEKLTEKDKVIAEMREKLKNEAVDHKATIHALESRYNNLTLKYKETLKQNEQLEVRVEECKKQLMQLEQCASTNEANNLKSKQEYEIQMESCLDVYKDLKANYNDLLKDITEKFEVAYETLHKKKCELEAENEMLRQGAGGDCIDKYM